MTTKIKEVSALLMMEYILSRLMARLNEVEEKMKVWNGFKIFKLKVESWNGIFQFNYSEKESKKVCLPNAKSYEVKIGSNFPIINYQLLIINYKERQKGFEPSALSLGS